MVDLKLPFDKSNSLKTIYHICGRMDYFTISKDWRKKEFLFEFDFSYNLQKLLIHLNRQFYITHCIKIYFMA